MLMQWRVVTPSELDGCVQSPFPTLGVTNAPTNGSLFGPIVTLTVRCTNLPQMDRKLAPW